MKNQLKGIALILISILFTVAFNIMGLDAIGDLSIQWSGIFLIVGIVGLVLVFIEPKQND